MSAMLELLLGVTVHELGVLVSMGERVGTTRFCTGGRVETTFVRPTWPITRSLAAGDDGTVRETGALGAATATAAAEAAGAPAGVGATAAVAGVGVTAAVGGVGATVAVADVGVIVVGAGVVLVEAIVEGPGNGT